MSIEPPGDSAADLSRPPESFPGRRRREIVWLVALLAAFFAFDLATYNWYPQLWCDEVWFSEPPVNCVTEGVFHSRADKFQPPNTFPVINCPMYLMIQVPWLHVAGTSVLAIRSFNYLLMALASLLVWMIAWRFELIRSAAARLMLVVLIHLGYGMSFAYRCSRPDILAMVDLLLLVLAFTIANRRIRFWAILLLCAATFWIGFQVAFFAGFACIAAVLFLRRISVRELLAVALGLAFGGVSVIAFLHWQDALANFISVITSVVGRRYGHGPTSLGGKLLYLLLGVAGSYIDDFSTSALLVGMAVMLGVAWRHLNVRTVRFAGFCASLIFGTPLVFDLLGHWAFYYSYLRFVPACLALFAIMSDLSRSPSGARLINGFALAMVVLAMAVGLPMRLFLAARYSQLMPRAELQRIIQAHIKPDDIVLSDIAPFFEVKSVAKVSYCTTYSTLLVSMHVEGGHDFTPGERSAFTAMVLRTDKINAVTNHIGGHWQAVTEPFGDTQDFSPLLKLSVIGRRLASYSTQPQTQRYQLQIFRRSPGSAGRQPIAEPGSP